MKHQKLFIFALMILMVIFAALSAQAGQTDALFEINYQTTPTNLNPKSQGLTQIIFKFKNGAHLSAEAPLKIMLSGTNIQLSKTNFGSKDAKFSSDSARFSIPFTIGEQKGSAIIDADMVFFVCAPNICERQSKRLNISIPVR